MERRSEPESQSSQDTGSPAAKRPRWHLLYFLLVAFDVLTVGVSLYLNHRLMDMYTDSIRVNQEWTRRRDMLSELRRLAGAVNAPGNDVFGSRKAGQEAGRMKAALEEFDAAVTAHRHEIQDNVRDGNGPRLLRQLDGVSAAMTNMVEEAQMIFGCFIRGEAAKAGERMAIMDRKFAKLSEELEEARSVIQSIQNRYFEHQFTLARSLRRCETIIASAIILMVCGIALYGHMLARSVKRSMRENEKNLEVIQTSERRYRLLFESTPVPTLVCDDSNQRFLAVNEAALRHYGYSREEFLAMGLNDLEHDCDASASVQSRSAEGFSSSAASVWRHRTSRGSLIYVEASTYSFNFEGKPALLVLAHDITLRQQAETALLDSEARAQRAHAEAEALLTTISTVFVGVDVAGNIRRWNLAAEQMFGISAQAALGRHLGECGIPWDWARVEQAVVDCLGMEKSLDLGDVPFTRSDGSKGFLHLIFAPRGAHNVDDLSFTMLGMDTTRRHLLESQLRQAQKLESIGQLAAGIAHEINTPTQFIGDNLRFLHDSFRDMQTALDLLPRLLECASRGAAEDEWIAQAKTCIATSDLDFLKAEIPTAIEQSREGASRVAKIVQAMKDFSHPDAGELKPTDLNKAIEATATVARSEWKEVAELRLDLDRDLPLVPCLPGEFNQVILNLIVNAAHAIAETPAVREGANGTITLSTRRVGDWAEICVTDTGTGIPEHARSKLFDPFFTTKPVGKGTGQGLFIARNVIVEKHRGSIAFETELGKGTSFLVRLQLNPLVQHQKVAA